MTKWNYSLFMVFTPLQLLEFSHFSSKVTVLVAEGDTPLLLLTTGWCAFKSLDPRPLSKSMCHEGNVRGH